MESNTILQSFKIQDKLNPLIWNRSGDGEYVIKPEVREKLIEIAENFIDFLGVDVDVEDITMTGSLSNYNWSSFSDIDLHIIVDFDSIDIDDDLLRQLFNSKKTIWNSTHDVEVYGFEVEVYVQNQSEPHFATGVYSIMYDEWINEPQQEEVTFDDEKLLSKASTWTNMIDGVYEKANLLDPEETLSLIEKVKDKLKKYRSCGLEKNGEYSYENLTFKFLRRNGYIQKLFDLKNKITDDILSLE
tara:strand:+ start:1055 stop:1786 length:732 start_codon:yes stop_codon:yes gene_type:complete